MKKKLKSCFEKSGCFKYKHLFSTQKIQIKSEAF